jgi:hypothetical protein
MAWLRQLAFDDDAYRTFYGQQSRNSGIVGGRRLAMIHRLLGHPCPFDYIVVIGANERHKSDSLSYVEGYHASRATLYRIEIEPGDLYGDRVISLRGFEPCRLFTTMTNSRE